MQNSKAVLLIVSALIVLVLGYLVLAPLAIDFLDSTDISYGGSSDHYARKLIRKYGKSFNANRKSRHIPTIDRGWTVQRVDSTEILWWNQALLNQSGPGHAWKISSIKNGVLVSEEDTFNFEQGDFGERLIVTKSLVFPDSMKFEFNRHYYKTNIRNRSTIVDTSKIVNFNFADSVLRAWKFVDLYVR